MDQSPAAAFARRKIANALMAYAQKHGWGHQDYEVWMRPNLEWGRIHVVLVARAFQGRDRFESYSEVREFLEHELKDDPELVDAIGLVLKDPQQAAEGGIFGIGPDYELVNLSEEKAGRA